MIIGIAGGTCSGNTSVAKLLANKINVQVISLDQYFKDPSTFPIMRGHPDYDRMEALDWEKILQDVDSGAENTIVEGFLVLAHQPLREKIEKPFYIDAAEDVLINRRLIKEPDIAEGYIHVVRERHKSLVLPTRKYADVILDGRKSIMKLAAEIEEYMNQG